MTVHPCLRASVPLLLFVLAACATAPAGGRPAEQQAVSDRPDDSVIRIEVKHDRADGGTATIYVQPVAGVRASLGTVNAGETRVFDYVVEAETRTVTLIAINSSGQAMLSRQTTVPRGAGLVWSLQVNNVRIRSGGS